ncbi:uncharacterized protein BDV17DRAFT_257727 [Aspergillus undulatus]|uniref:uncharacterized protein n=1 Tax=Aspergillus undulatus TaxID=1810928 RepID=UPI003CCD1D60
MVLDGREPKRRIVRLEGPLQHQLDMDLGLGQDQKVYGNIEHQGRGFQGSRSCMARVRIIFNGVGGLSSVWYIFDLFAYLIVWSGAWYGGFCLLLVAVVVYRILAVGIQ